MKPRILQVVRQFHPSIGGVERWALDLSRELVRRGYPIEVLTLDRTFQRLDAPLPAQEVIDGVPVHRVPFVGRGRVFAPTGVLAHARRHDLVHVHDLDAFSELLGAARLLHRRRLVLTTHGGFFHTPRLARAKNLYFRTLSRATLHAYDAVVAPSEQDRVAFSRVAPGVVTIPLGIDHDALARVRRAPEPGRLLAVTRLATHKRIDRLLRAFAIAARGDARLRLGVIGPDPDAERLRWVALARDLGVAHRVTFHGVVTESEHRHELGRAQWFVSASDYEGFGLAALEAMAAGAVPLLNDIPTYRELIDPGTTGLLVNFSDPEAAAQALADAVRMPASRHATLAEAARRAAARFALPRIVDHHEALYDEVLAGRSERRAG